MKKAIYILSFVISIICFVSCGEKEKEKPLNITGTWSITQITTKSASLGGTTVDIYITFNEDKSFSLSQKIGDGRYTRYQGTYTLTGTTLDGKYSDGKAWGSSYEVSQNDERTSLTLSSVGEDYTYKKAELPADLLY